MSEALYVRVRGRVRGPFSRQRLLQLADRGRFAGHHEVSDDGVHWTRASDRPELFSTETEAIDAADNLDRALPPVPAVDWYYVDAQSRECGPVSLRELRDLVHNKMIDGATFVWNETFSDWQLAADVSELNSLFYSAQNTTMNSRQAIRCTQCGDTLVPGTVDCPRCYALQDGQSRHAKAPSRSSAAIFALFLGGIGAHKFYLNKPFQGVLYLCFCWTFIPAIISTVEGIHYLLLSDSEFIKHFG